MQVGYDVEKDLQEGDVRLTMGGEPTFVSIDDFEGAEWNSIADGPLKRKLAYDLTLGSKIALRTEVCSISDKGNGTRASYFPVGNTHSTGAKTDYQCGKMMRW